MVSNYEYHLHFRSKMVTTRPRRPPGLTRHAPPLLSQVDWKPHAVPERDHADEAELAPSLKRKELGAEEDIYGPPKGSSDEETGQPAGMSLDGHSSSPALKRLKPSPKGSGGSDSDSVLSTQSADIPATVFKRRTSGVDLFDSMGVPPKRRGWQKSYGRASNITPNIHASPKKPKPEPSKSKSNGRQVSSIPTIDALIKY
jgi:hypothetical protein